MARINIEGKLFKDNRFISLCIKTGSKREALGALCEAWIFAQEYASKDNPRALIPLDDWNNQEFAPQIFESKLARIEGNSVYMVGAEEQFKWLIQRQEAGRKGGRPPKNQETDRLATANRPPSGRNPLPLTLPLSTNSNTNTNSNSTGDVERGVGKTNFKIHPDLNDDAINDVLSKISPNAQSRWLRVYKDPDWIKDNLKEIISFYTARGDTIGSNWGELLHRGLNRAKAARKNAKGKGPMNASDPNFWNSLNLKKVGGSP